ncbi:hypothetical protein [Gillisia limnaea]|uniref:Lipoprotein n=1 Tax=Gillisia limnaea (strain DSM 15749 / LMG 21470 / R-8282) TaxID=865937 RepID=H2BV08_GILLR|nr:hypothetical protein [Gillisia limnaea]EHQ03898.1 hypothetical protein Gilli_3295 [Gillisia limnaea DSM 15749]
MKTSLNLLLIILFLSFVSCSKQDDCDNPVDCLPPATQTGAGTIGCLINGEVFRPGGSQFPGPTQRAVYNTSVEGKYYFSLTAKNRSTNKSIGILLRDQQIGEGETYFLISEGEFTNFAVYNINIIEFQTNNEFTGEITFSKFDDINGIVSGTFWFDGINEEGEIVEIREGRFDMKYN